MKPRKPLHEIEGVTVGSHVSVPQGARCERCSKPIGPEGYGKWCSSDCRQAASEEVSGAKLRAVVFERDKGFCKDCGLDTVELRAQFDLCIELAKKDPHHAGAWAARLIVLDRDGWDRHAITTGAPLHEVDHDPPRVNGGTNNPALCVTRCLPCHKARTADQARSRAAARHPRRRFGR